MTRFVARVAVVTAGVALAVVVTHSAHTQEKKSDPAAGQGKTVRPVTGKLTDYGKVEYSGHTRCATCHEKLSDAYKGEKRDEFVYLNESTTWARQDLHSYAYEALQSELGKRMNKLLGWQTKDGKPLNTWEAAECLACHAVDKHPELSLADKAALTQKEGVDRVFTIAAGIGCEACHGPGRAWDVPHAESKGA